MDANDKQRKDDEAPSTSSSGMDKFAVRMIMEDNNADKDFHSKLVDTFLNLEVLDTNLFRFALQWTFSKTRFLPLQCTPSTIGLARLIERVRRSSNRPSTAGGQSNRRRSSEFVKTELNEKTLLFRCIHMH